MRKLTPHQKVVRAFKIAKGIDAGGLMALKFNLERRVEELERKFETLYHRTYAVTMRADRIKKSREKYYRLMRIKLYKTDKRIKKNAAKLGHISASIGEGKSVVLLTRTEMARFKAWLKIHPGRKV